MNAFRWVVVRSVVVLLLVAGSLSARALAQEAPPAAEADGAVVVAPASPRTFGTADEVAYTLHAQDFETDDSARPWGGVFTIPSVTASWERSVTSGVATWAAGIRLPAGAELTRLEVSACDRSTSAELTFRVIRIHEPAGLGNERVTQFGSTGVAPDPGCGLFSVPVEPGLAPVFIDNANNSYIVVLVNQVGTSFSAARVFYRLRVSPAPAVATFGDVPPSHPFFQFIEALVDSGITAGCSVAPPLYCPDAPLTRGQMAVFLSKALGLHFTP